MQDILEKSLRIIQKRKTRSMRMLAVLLILSLVVSLDVFWSLRQPGLTLAGNADCNITEHTHDECCQSEAEPCPFEEHTHTLECYSNNSADTETLIEWQKMFKDYPYSGDIRSDLVGIAKTQVGYTESTENFEVGSDGVRRGYTRYGAWYGAPYNDWSAMFVSFCLHYAGANPDEFPPNIGASSMAQLWYSLGKYAPNGDYVPISGDLIFFDNTVGIVSEVIGPTVSVIVGNLDDCVCTTELSIYDESIDGWGITELSHTDDKKAQEIEALGDKLWDISNGPAVFIFVGSQTSPRSLFSLLRNTQKIIDLLDYLEKNGGSYFFTLLDKNNQELPKNEAGQYIVQPDTAYKLTVSFTSHEGFVPGTFQYQVPNGLLVDGGEGTFILTDQTNVGDWEVTNEGLITLNFNEHINNHTDITISATLGIHFPLQDDPIDFDGKISVTVEKPPDPDKMTLVTKWGIQGSETTAGKTNPDKIYWNVSITGQESSVIVGNVLTDRVVTGAWIGDQHYTESDMAEGLRMGAADPYGGWHSWTVYPGDPNLTWTADGWSYTMPEKITCWCGEVTLGNNGWIYYIDYSSTPDRTATPGTLYYMNRFTVDNQYVDGGASFTSGEILGEITKEGTFVSNAGSGVFLWQFQATIPGRKEGERSEYHWYIMDYMHLMNADGYNAGPMHNEAHLSTVTATFGGITVNVPRIQDVTEDDLFAWDPAWTAVSNGVSYGREATLLCRCHCDENSCRFWENGCQQYWVEMDNGTWITNGFCQCWNTTENATFTFTYKTDDLSMVETYGGLGYQLLNVAELYYKPNGGSEGTLVSTASASVPIPNVFEKALTHDFDGYTANYKITINESKLVLTDGTPLTIHDMMTTTLAYIRGSLVITTEDRNGNISVLQEGIDYTVSYDGTGNQTNEKGESIHALDIVILHPQPVMYILDYDTTLIMPDKVTEGIKYTNSASISLWGDKVKDNTVEKVYADINIASKSYKIKLFKTCALTNAPLAGAIFGLYNEQGGLITTATTDANGELIFQTNVIEGIILRDHILYYVQEIQAPPGYKLDDKKFPFCFCDETTYSCEHCDAVLAGTDGQRIPFERFGEIDITNEIADYDLPSTGGTGTLPLILVSVIFIITPLVYRFIRRRKRERRAEG